MKRRRFLNIFKEQFNFQEFIDEADITLDKRKIQLAVRDQEKVIGWIGEQFKQDMQSLMAVKQMQVMIKRQQRMSTP